MYVYYDCNNKYQLFTHADEEISDRRVMYEMFGGELYSQGIYCRENAQQQNHANNSKYSNMIQFKFLHMTLMSIM